MRRRAALIFLATAVLFLTGCKIELLHDLEEREANEILVILDQYGIKGEKAAAGDDRNRTWTILIDEADAVKARKVLLDMDLPRPKGTGFKDVFQQSGLMPTQLEEQAKLIQAYQGEIAETIERIDGVVDVRVHVVMPNKDAYLPDETIPDPTASVLIKYRPEPGGEKPYSDEEIKSLVSRAVENLTTSNVIIISTEKIIEKRESEKLFHFGPLTLTQNSKKPLRMLLIGGVVLFLVPWAIVIFLARKLLAVKNTSV